LDEKWKNSLQEIKWPTKLLPQIAGDAKQTLIALINGYLFTSLFKASIESLASENASRLDAMQRAEKNIGDLLDDLNKKYHRLRQSPIDEELFDVVSGFEALRK
jgi:F-type H+-transporting ATPase subunit gamma